MNAPSLHATPNVEFVNGWCSRSSDHPAMTVWEVIEAALHHLRKSPQWLANELSKEKETKIQAVSNWKARGRVPPARFRDIANVLGITVDQLEGLAPLPWSKDLRWPFSVELHEKAETLNTEQLLDLEIAMWERMDEPLPARLREAAAKLRAQDKRAGEVATGVPGLEPAKESAARREN